MRLSCNIYFIFSRIHRASQLVYVIGAGSSTFNDLAESRHIHFDLSELLHNGL